MTQKTLGVEPARNGRPLACAAANPAGDSALPIGARLRRGDAFARPALFIAQPSPNLAVSSMRRSIFSAAWAFHRSRTRACSVDAARALCCSATISSRPVLPLMARSFRAAPCRVLLGPTTEACQRKPARHDRTIQRVGGGALLCAWHPMRPLHPLHNSHTWPVWTAARHTRRVLTTAYLSSPSSTLAVACLTTLSDRCRARHASRSRRNL